MQVLRSNFFFQSEIWTNIFRYSAGTTKKITSKIHALRFVVAQLLRLTSEKHEISSYVMLFHKILEKFIIEINFM